MVKLWGKAKDPLPGYTNVVGIMTNGKQRFLLQFVGHHRASPFQFRAGENITSKCQRHSPPSSAEVVRVPAAVIPLVAFIETASYMQDA